MPYDIFTHYWLSFICNKTLNDNFVADKYTLPEVALAYCVYEFQFNILNLIITYATLSWKCSILVLSFIFWAVKSKYKSKEYFLKKSVLSSSYLSFPLYAITETKEVVFINIYSIARHFTFNNKVNCICCT